MRQKVDIMKGGSITQHTANPPSIFWRAPQKNICLVVFLKSLKAGNVITLHMFLRSFHYHDKGKAGLDLKIDDEWHKGQIQKGIRNASTNRKTAGG